MNTCMADWMGRSGYTEVPIELGGMGMNGMPVRSPPLLEHQPQSFQHQGQVSWKTIFPRKGVEAGLEVELRC